MAKAKKKESLTPEERVQAALVPESEQPYPVPANWCWTRIANLCYLSNGKAFKPTDWSETGIPIVRIQNLNNPEAKYNLYSGIVEDKFRLCGDELLFAWSGTPGTSFGAHIWWGKEAVLNQHIFRVDFDEKHINKIYFKYAINQQLDMLISVAHGGAGLQHVTKGVFEATPIPLPPLPEQQRIVDRIESLFAKLDEGKQKAQDALDSFETRKAAILQKAFTGELTAKWRKEHGVGMESWKALTLGDIAEYKKGPFGSSITKAMFVPKGNHTYKVYEQGNAIRKTVDYGHYYISEQKYLELKNFAVRTDDIIISCAGTIGEVFKLPQDCEPGIINQALMRVRIFSNINEQYFIYYFGEILKGDVIDQANGTAIKNIPPFKIMKAMKIELPSLPEQTEIIRILDDLLAKEQQAKEAAEGVLEQIDLMKKAILARAFRGELGTNDPREESAVEMLKQVL